MTPVRRVLEVGRARTLWDNGRRGRGRSTGWKPGAGPRGRLPRLVTAALGVCLLAGAIFSTVTAGREAAVATLDNAMSSDAALHASALKEYFERAQGVDLLLANDSAMGQFEPGQGQLSGPPIVIASAQASKAMAYLQKLYPGRISEACLIDDSGTELARVVRGKIAPASELSTQEAENPFFAPTMRLPKGRVYQAAPYVSPDTREWVISNSTPMVSASGRTWGLVHFEVVLDTFRPGADGDNEPFTHLIVDNGTGQILLDSEQRLVGAASLGRAGSAGLRALVGRHGASASSTVDGHRMAVARVPVSPDNANSWSVVVSSTETEAGGWSGAIGPAPVATALAALLLLAFAGLNLRSSRRADRQGEARYRTLVDQSSDLVLVTDRAGRADFISPSVQRLLKHGDKDLKISPNGSVDAGPIDLIAVVDPQDREQLSAVLLAAAPGHMSTAEFRITGENGTSTYEVSVQDLTADPSVSGLLLTAHDVTERLELNQALEHRSLHDTLTGLPNRALLADRFEQALRGADRDGTSVGLLLLDLDRFKEVNDTFGHHYGDELLRQIGPRLTGALRGVDTIARLGGDEFAVLLPNMHKVEDATKVAATLRTALAEQFHVHGVDLDVEASVGVVMSGEHGQDPITLMQHADIAMYVAKTQHLGVFVYHPNVDGHSATKLSLIGDLRRALDYGEARCGRELGGELVLYYQPKVNIDTGDVVGAEALVRWEHPEQGLLMPDAFIPLAEHTGLINPLTHHIMDMALAQARTWMHAGRPLPIAVNLSSRNLHDEGFADTVAELLAEHDVPPHLLDLELTESAIMIDPERARQTLERLSALGVRLSLDDFGAGSTSLSQLTSMPIDEIKIDRAFVIAMADDPSNALIVTSVIDLGHNLGLTLVAEGVETAKALSALAGFGCDVAQGYHISRPIPVAAFDAWCAGRPITLAPPKDRVVARRQPSTSRDAASASI
jgi:diguanylate cyclase (GGDEF)-like protein